MNDWGRGTLQDLEEQEREDLQSACPLPGPACISPVFDSYVNGIVQ